MKIMVTGSSGTIGTALCEELGKSHELAPVDVQANKWSGEINSTTLRIDLRKSDEVATLPKDIDMVIHCAANARVYDLVVAPNLAFDNMSTTYNVLEYMWRNDIPRIIFASSREVYGTVPNVESVREDMVDISRCESPYTASKMAGEALIYSFNNVYGIEYLVFRFSNVYGRYDDSNRVVPTWIRLALNDEPMTIYGPQKRLDFTYLDDVVRGVLKAVESFDQVRGNAVNIAYGRAENLLSVAESIRDMLGSESEFVIKEKRPGELWNYQADLTKAKSLLDFSPEVDIQEGLERAVSWYRSWLGVSQSPAI